MNEGLWIWQAILAFAFAVVAYNHSIAFDRTVRQKGQGWLAAVGKPRMRVIGALELLGAVGLILPGLTGILTWLTPVAAVCLGLLMAAAAVYHARRPGEVPNLSLNLVLMVVSAWVAYGRILAAPLP